VVYGTDRMNQESYNSGKGLAGGDSVGVGLVVSDGD
jgi:hypothetical protein